MKSSGYINYANGDGEQQHRAKMGTGNKWAPLTNSRVNICSALVGARETQKQKQNSENPDVLLPVFFRKGFLLNIRASSPAPSFLLRWNGDLALPHTFSFSFCVEHNWKKTSNAEVWSLFSTLPGLARGTIWESTLCSIHSPPPRLFQGQAPWVLGPLSASYLSLFPSWLKTRARSSPVGWFLQSLETDWQQWRWGRNLMMPRALRNRNNRTRHCCWESQLTGHCEL